MMRLPRRSRFFITWRPSGCRRRSAQADLVLTAGELYTDPALHGPSKIAGETRFVLDLRSLSDATMTAVAAEARAAAARIGAAYRVRIDLGATSDSPRRGDGRAAAGETPGASSTGRSRWRAARVTMRPCLQSSRIPTAMIFVRNEHGSHNPDEAMSLDDFAVGTRCLLGLLMDFPF